MPFIEAPTTFYLGRRFDPDQNQMVDDVVYYDSRDLVTHAVVVGMTGSGKTGLCITLLEEAIMDNIPAIIIDPKGDITNLMLTFPNLTPEEFLPWINEDDALRAGLEPQEYARDLSQRWREGLKSWGITAQRVSEFKRRSNISIFTPGSDAGLPISIMDALQPPREGWVGYEEQHRERISGIVTALLALTGIKAMSKDREHVLLSNIIEYSWAQGLPLTLQDIILQVQQPPFTKLGVFDVNTFFPEKERFKLAIELNNIIASPSFKTWLQGEPLDISNLLYTRDGRPRVSIFYIAHLSDEQRSFIITLLLENIHAWMRTLGGTSSLRAILYFDEVFGHIPPYPRNPPTKEPLLRLLKQARAFGLGLILATQNPGDLDYKGLSNAGTWFLGKLQTENDKRKVLDGLSTAASASQPIDLEQLDHLLSTIQPRVFIMNNVHDSGGPLLIHTRWAMTYLRGPLTRYQVTQLMAPQKQPYAPTPPAYATGTYQAVPAQAAPPAYNPQPAAYPPAPPAPPTYNPPPTVPGFESRPTPPLPPGVPPPPPTLPDFPGVTPPPSLPGFGTYQQPPAPPQPTYGAVPIPPNPPMAAPPPAPNYAPAVYNPPQPAFPPAPPASSSIVTGNVTPQDEMLPTGYSFTPPALPSTVTQFYLPTNIPLQQAVAYYEQQSGMRANNVTRQIVLYRPFLMAQSQIRYMDRKTGINFVETYAYHVNHVERSGLIHWDQFTARPVDSTTISRQPFGEAAYGEISPGLVDKKRMSELEKEVLDYIYKSAGVNIPAHDDLKIYGNPGAPFADFQSRLHTTARSLRDAEIDKITQKYAGQFDKLEDRYRNKQREFESHQQSLQGLGRETLATMGEAAISLFQGRTTYTLSRVTRVRRFQEQAKQNVSDSEQDMQQIEGEMNELQQKFEAEVARINDKWSRIAANYKEMRITPAKKDIHMELFGIAWKPYYYVFIMNRGEILPAWQGMVSSQVDNRLNYQRQVPPSAPQIAPPAYDPYQQQVYQQPPAQPQYPQQPVYQQPPAQPQYPQQPVYQQPPAQPQYPQQPAYQQPPAQPQYPQQPYDPYAQPGYQQPYSQEPNIAQDRYYNEQGYNVPPMDSPNDDY